MRENLHIQEPHRKERERDLAAKIGMAELGFDIFDSTVLQGLRLGESPAKLARQFGRRRRGGRKRRRTIVIQRKVHYHRSNNHHFPFSSSLRRRRRWRPRFHSPGIIDMRKWSQRRRFSLLRQWESWEVAADENILTPTGFVPPMVWGFGVCMVRCKWEWEYVLVSESEKWEITWNLCVFRVVYLTNQYSSFRCSITKLIFLILDAMSGCHAGIEKWGTRAHQARVPQKVVDRYIVPKQCFWAKYFNNWW